MPTILLNESAAASAPSSLVNETTGELTLEAQVMSDFLSHVDFSSVLTLKGIDEECDEVGSEKTKYVPGWLVAEATDLNDLASMFGHYVQARHESAMRNGATLEE